MRGRVSSDMKMQLTDPTAQQFIKGAMLSILNHPDKNELLNRLAVELYGEGAKCVHHAKANKCFDVIFERDKHVAKVTESGFYSF